VEWSKTAIFASFPALSRGHWLCDSFRNLAKILYRLSLWGPNPETNDLKMRLTWMQRNAQLTRWSLRRWASFLTRILCIVYYLLTISTDSEDQSFIYRHAPFCGLTFDNFQNLQKCDNIYFDLR